MVSIFAVLLMISLYIPFIGTILLLTLPLPAMVQTIRHGLKPGISVGLVSLPVSLIAGSLGGLMFAIPVSAAGVIMGFTTEEKSRPKRLLQQPLHIWFRSSCCLSSAFSFLD